MLPRQAVLSLEEEGAGEFQPHPDEAGALDQDGVERRDRLVQERIPVLLRPPRPPGGAHRGEAGEEQHVRAVFPFRRPRRQRAQDGERGLVVTGAHHRAGAVHLGVVREVRTVLRGGCGCAQQQSDQEGAKPGHDGGRFQPGHLRSAM